MSYREARQSPTQSSLRPGAAAKPAITAYLEDDGTATCYAGQYFISED